MFKRPKVATKEAPPPAEVAAPPTLGPPASSEPIATKEPPPDVEVTNLGMHIGGSRNTEEEKSPLREAVRTRYDELLGCYAQGNAKDGTFGVDMRIDKDGGPARISKPRSAFGKDVTECMVKVMKTVEFPKPANGMSQTVSYSLRFRRRS